MLLFYVLVFVMCQGPAIFSILFVGKRNAVVTSVFGEKDIVG